MKKLLEEIREIIHFVTQAVYYYRQQNYAKAHMAAMAVINIGEQYFNDAENIGFDESTNLLLPIWKELLEATENGDEIQLADIYENQLKLAWTSFEPVGNGRWEYLEKKAYEIPITENADE